MLSLLFSSGNSVCRNHKSALPDYCGNYLLCLQRRRETYLWETIQNGYSYYHVVVAGFIFNCWVKVTLWRMSWAIWVQVHCQIYTITRDSDVQTGRAYVSFVFFWSTIAVLLHFAANNIRLVTSPKLWFALSYTTYQSQFNIVGSATESASLDESDCASTWQYLAVYPRILQGWATTAS